MFNAHVNVLHVLASDAHVKKKFEKQILRGINIASR